MPSFENDSSGSDSDSDFEEEEIVSTTIREKVDSALNQVYDKTGAALIYIKPYVHVAWIPLVLFLGSSEPPFPSMFDLITPPM
jgi:hypothetical protein